MQEPRSPVREGDILAGKYRVERVLGAGGMGVVVAAMHVQLAERVAVKLLLPELSRSPELAARFVREAQSCARIKSEHVARVSDVGTLPNGTPYMVMEYLAGTDLAAQIQAKGALMFPEAVDYVLQATEAIAEAHSLGIVHRDLKPANLFLTRRADGSALVKVLDFGISKIAAEPSASDQGLTSTGAALGSPYYMSPEQVTDVKSVDARADIWALGVVLHELLTCTRPFHADTAPGLFVAIATQAPKPVRMFRPDVPPGLELAILRCLEKDPARRVPNVAELARLLMPFATTEGRVSAERISRTVPPNALSLHHGTVSMATHPPLATADTQLYPSPPTPSNAPLIGYGPTQTSNAWSGTRAPTRRYGGSVAAVVIAIVLALFGGLALLSFIGVVSLRALLQGGAPLDTGPSFECSGNQDVTQTGLHIERSSGTAITTSANCHFTCIDCVVSAPVAVQAGGNSVVTFENGSVTGTQTLVDADGNAEVKLLGKMKTSGAIKQTDNAVVTAPGYSGEGNR